MDVREISRECVGYIESVLADMCEVGENDDGDEEDGERVPSCEMEERGAKGEDGRYEPGDKRDDECLMEEISKEDSNACKKEKESIRREFGMDGESDDEECEHAGDRLWNGFCEENNDDSAREWKEKYDRLLEWMAEVARYECGRENKQCRESREEVFEKCVEVDMCGDAEKIGEGKEQWSRFGKCRYSSLHEIVPCLRDPVVGVEIRKRIVGGDHTPHDGEVEQGACTEKL